MNKLCYWKWSIFLLPWLPVPTDSFAQTLAFHQSAQQSAVKRPATLKLRDAILLLRDRYRVNVLFEEKLLDGFSVSEDAINKTKSIDDNLNALLHAHGLQFQRIKKNTYLIYSTKTSAIGLERKPAGSVSSISHPNAVLPVAPVSLNRAVELLPNEKGQVQVSGRVTDENGQGLPGVNVIEKGTQNGTSTSATGAYTLSVSGPESVLLFSFIGYVTGEAAVGDKSVVNISLKPDEQTLKEVVVTAIGLERSRKSLGYSVQKVDSEELVNSRETSVASALSGKAAGVQVTTSSGAVGSAAQIRIRGSASLTGNNSPLFVVDGVPIDNGQNRTLSGGDGNAGVVHSNRSIDVNPDDIETMTVLKGPAATALYGIRAAAGAIIITTKRGSRSAVKQSRISLSSSYIVNEINRLPKWQDKYAQGAEVNGVPQYRDPSTGVITSFGPEHSSLTYSSQPSRFSNQGLIVPRTDPSSNGIPVQAFDNFGNFFVKGSTFDNHLSFSGGGENSNYYFSLGKLKQKGIIPTEEFDRLTFKMSGDLSLTKKLNVSGSVTYSKTGGTRAQQGSNSSGVIMGLMRAPFTFDNTNGYSDPLNEPLAYSLPDGSQRNSGGNIGGYDNPFWSVKKNQYKDEVDRVIGFMQSDYEVLPWLKLMGRLGLDMYNDNRLEAFSKNSRGLVAGRVSQENYLQRAINSDLILTANRRLTEDLDLTVLLGHNYFNRTERRQTTTGSGLNIPDFFNPSGASTLTGGTNLARRKLNAAYGDVRLTYRNYLFLNFTGRNEWSSTLPKENSSFFYPSISASFAFTDAFNIKSNWLTAGKLRASYAQVGNDSPIYSLYNTYSPASINATLITSGGILFPFQNQLGLTVGNSSGNPQLRPEIRVSSEFGGEFRFLKNRLGVDLTYYNSISKDLIVSVPLPNSSGFTSTIRNVGEISNKGWEVVVDATPVETGKFTWNLALNWSRNVSLVKEIADGIESIGVTSVGPLGQIRLVKGQPFAVIYGNDFVRDAQGRVVIDDARYMADGKTLNANYGFPSRDPNPKPIGNTNPKWIAGLRNTFQYGNFSLTTLLDARYKFDIYNGTLGSMNQSGTSKESEDRYLPTVFEGVKKSDGGVNNIEVVKGQYWYTGVGGGFGSGVNTQFVEDGSWLRMRELNLSYRLPGNWLKKIGVSNASFTLTGRNIFLLTNYSGVDPETNLNGDNNSAGYDYFTMPNTRSYGAALTLTL
ncbi:SusC/RagA family TonB-linked outer membrane protein [Larkinella bovis]|uniref:SusC/RagA family TonB-linked outer membrane protein n=1 Tax=Larkinella bovis TaxID=683041 RepID=A0ABW0IC36_9BACT